MRSMVEVLAMVLEVGAAKTRGAAKAAAAKD